MPALRTVFPTPNRMSMTHRLLWTGQFPANFGGNHTAAFAPAMCQLALWCRPETPDADASVPLPSGLRPHLRNVGYHIRRQSHGEFSDGVPSIGVFHLCRR